MWTSEIGQSWREVSSTAAASESQYLETNKLSGSLTGFDREVALGTWRMGALLDLKRILTNYKIFV